MDHPGSMFHQLSVWNQYGNKGNLNNLCFTICTTHEIVRLLLSFRIDIFCSVSQPAGTIKQSNACARQTPRALQKE